jgi:AcrR family transcriptional regulator
VPESLDPHHVQLLDSAEIAFNSKGLQSVGMDELRAASGLPLRRIYQLYAGKDELIGAVLRRRHNRMMAEIKDHTSSVEAGPTRVLAVFDWLHRWFSDGDFRGCPWMNAYGELGAVSKQVADETRYHQRAFRRLVTGIVKDAGYDSTVAEGVYLLVEGAVATAGVEGTAAPATRARSAARVLLGL